MTGHTIFEQSETQRHRLDVRTHTRTHARTHTHTHFGDKQSKEKTGLDVLDLVRCKAEQTR